MGTGKRRGDLLRTPAEINRDVIENGPLVTTIVQDFRGGKIEYEDLIQIGHEGLIKAAREFDVGRGKKFSKFASAKIRGELFNATEAAKNQGAWYPKESGEVQGPIDADSIERIYQWDAWGEIGNAMAIAEAWAKLDSAPEDLGLLHAEIADKTDRFLAAFISLTAVQRKLVRWVFLQEPQMTIPAAARELGISRFMAGRLLKRALKTMREVIQRMEVNEKKQMAAKRAAFSIPGGKMPMGTRLIPPGRHG
jgi:RNA polymerase sigma factor (sigma-70 family)